MGIFKDKDRKALKTAFEDLRGDVKLLMFTQELECQTCQLTREMMEELAGLSDKLSLEVLDFVADSSRAKELGVDKIPAVIVMGERDHGIRFYGVPAGYELGTLVGAITDVSREEHGLPGSVIDELAKVDQPVRVQVMITPT